MRKTKHREAIMKTPRMQKAFETIASAASFATEDAIALERKIGRAIREALDPALASLPVAVVKALFVALLVEATSAGRRTIARHPLCEPSWLAEAEAEVARRGEEARKEREARAAARADVSDDARAASN